MPPSAPTIWYVAPHRHGFLYKAEIPVLAERKPTGGAPMAAQFGVIKVLFRRVVSQTVVAIVGNYAAITPVPLCTDPAIHSPQIVS